jgi:cytochrome c oxidase assembly protein subunit 11
VDAETHQTAGQAQARGPKGRHRLIALACLGFIAAMVGVTYASVPLYAMFCSLTGFGGATRVASGGPLPAAIDRTLDIRFDANVAPGLPWAFRPVQRGMSVKIGETSLAHYEADNTAGAETRGNATYNVTPAQAGAYFVKLQCFCFEEQVLSAGERLDMPVVFYIDPAILDDPDLKGLKTITLSYTFFPSKAPAKPVARVEGIGEAKGGKPL